MNSIKFLVTFLLDFYVCVSALNILAIFPYEGKSHFYVYRVYLNELTKRGHDVTVISPFPEQSPPENYHDISLADSVKVAEDVMPADRSYWTIVSVGLYLTGTGVDNCRLMLANKQVQHLINTKPKFDVVVVEEFNTDCGLGVAYKLNSPVIGLTSATILPWHFKRFGIPHNPSYVAFHFLEGGTKPTLYQRIERLVFDAYFTSLYYLRTQRDNQNALAEYLGDVPPLEELARETKVLLLYNYFVMTGSRLLPSNVIEVGGFHVQDAKPLTGEVKDFVEGATNGVIYISFGSLVRTSSLAPEKIQAILDAMDELPHSFIWKCEDKSLIKKDKKKLYVSSWLPQVDILAHPKTLVFYSHAGMLGLTEAIHYGVPVVAMPVLGDQPFNAAAAEESGLAVQIQLTDLTKDTLVAAFKKVLQPRSRAHVAALSRAWHDRPSSALDTAVHWTEFVAKHPNMTLRAPAADVPFHRYTYLDVVGVVFIPLVILIFIWTK